LPALGSLTDQGDGAGGKARPSDKSGERLPAGEVRNFMAEWECPGPRCRRRSPCSFFFSLLRHWDLGQENGQPLDRESHVFLSKPHADARKRHQDWQVAIGFAWVGEFLSCHQPLTSRSACASGVGLVISICLCIQFPVYDVPATDRPYWGSSTQSCESHNSHEYFFSHVFPLLGSACSRRNSTNLTYVLIY
jgi:hypothetical protein